MAEEHPDGAAAAAVHAAADALDPEIDHVKKQFNLLLYRVGQIPGTTGAKLRGRFALALASLPWTVDTRHGPLSFVSLGKGPAARAGSIFTSNRPPSSGSIAFSPTACSGTSAPTSASTRYMRRAAATRRWWRSNRPP